MQILYMEILAILRRPVEGNLNEMQNTDEESDQKS